jgi:hypothetical protein
MIVKPVEELLSQGIVAKSISPLLPLPVLRCDHTLELVRHLWLS